MITVGGKFSFKKIFTRLYRPNLTTWFEYSRDY